MFSGNLLAVGLCLFAFAAGYLCRHFQLLGAVAAGVGRFVKRSRTTARAARTAADRRRRRRQLAGKSKGS